MPLTRYLTRWYVAVDEQEAVRLARGDGSPHAEITEGVELLHAEHGWAFWSDGRVTTSTGLPDALRATRSLSPAAVRLVSSCFHSSPPGPPQIAGGWRALADVAELAAEEVVEEGRREGSYDPPRVLRLRVRLTDRSERVWWARTASDADGVSFELRDERSALGARPVALDLN